jgi:hypothetical protein
MKRSGYIFVAGFMRLLSVMGSLWLFSLLMLMVQLGGTHIVRDWICFGVTISTTLCLILGMVTVASSKRLFMAATLYGALALAGLSLYFEVVPFIEDRVNASASFVDSPLYNSLIFALNILAPACTAFLCIKDLRRTEAATHHSPAT